MTTFAKLGLGLIDPSDSRHSSVAPSFCEEAVTPESAKDNVILASNAETALQMIEKDPNGFDIAFSDLVMPGLDSVALGQKIRQRLPRMPFVLTSDYSLVLKDTGHHPFDLLQKPYSVEKLSRVMRRAMMDRVGH